MFKSNNLFDKNLSSLLVITKTSKAPLARINIYIFDYPNTNYALIKLDKSTKFTQGYPITN